MHSAANCELPEPVRTTASTPAREAWSASALRAIRAAASGQTAGCWAISPRV